MKNTKKQNGFTIIEVMIVLAIAGLIMVIALIAIPQLQRNQRNTARKSIVARVSTELGNYSSNNNGRLPGPSDIVSFTERYLTADTVDLRDPKTGDQMQIVYYSDADAEAGDIAPTTDLGSMSYRTGVTCDGESLASGSARTFALWTTLEGGSTFCTDN